jgi:hypothetical protein
MHKYQLHEAIHFKVFGPIEAIKIIAKVLHFYQQQVETNSRRYLGKWIFQCCRELINQ